MNMLEDLQVTVTASSNGHASFRTNFGLAIYAMYRCGLGPNDEVDALYYWQTPCCLEEIPRPRGFSQGMIESFECPRCRCEVASHYFQPLNDVGDSEIDLPVLERAIAAEASMDPLAAVLTASALATFMEDHQNRVLELSGLHNVTTRLEVIS